MAKSYTRVLVSRSLIRGIIILFNIFALGTFFFIQVGSIFFIIPAAIIDVMYILGQERVGPRKDALQPSRKILRLTLYIIFASLLVFSAIFLFQVIKTS